MLDADVLVKDLIRMRGTKARNALAQELGETTTRIRNLENRATSSLDIELVSKWLEHFGSSLAIYFAAAAKGSELEAIRRNNGTISKFVSAMKQPEYAAQLTQIVNAVLDRAKLPGTDK